MTWSRACAFAIIASSLVAMHEPASAISVFVSAGDQVGQGYTRSRADGCFIIVPSHVVANTLATINVVGPKDLRSTAALEEPNLGNDIAILRIVKNGDLFCSSDDHWDDGAGLSALLEKNEPITGQLETEGPDGSQHLMQVQLIDRSTLGYVSIRPVETQDHILKGSSGSVFFVNGRPAGMLMEELLEGKASEVYRWDELSKLINSFFSGVGPDQGCEISINSDPHGARIFLDGKATGQTPKQIKLADRQQTYSLSLRYQNSFTTQTNISCSDPREKTFRISDLPRHQVQFLLSDHDSDDARISDCRPHVQANGTLISRNPQTLPEGTYTMTLSGGFSCLDGYSCEASPRKYELMVDSDRSYGLTFTKDGNGCHIDLRPSP